MQLDLTDQQVEVLTALLDRIHDSEMESDCEDRDSCEDCGHYCQAAHWPECNAEEWTVLHQLRDLLATLPVR